MKNYETMIEDILFFYALNTTYYVIDLEVYKTAHCGSFSTIDDAVNAELKWLKQDEVKK